MMRSNAVAMPRNMGPRPDSIKEGQTMPKDTAAIAAADNARLNLKVTTRAAEKARAHWEAIRGSAAPEEWKDAARTAMVLHEQPMCDAVQLALNEANGRATTHTVCTFEQVVALTSRFEHHLKAQGVPKSRWPGLTVRYHPAAPSARSYKYSVKSTHLTLRYARDGWRLDSCHAIKLYPRSGERCDFAFPEK